MARSRWYYLRRRRYRYYRRFLSKRFYRVENARKYKTKQRLEYMTNINIVANAQQVAMQINVNEMLPSMQGWDNASHMYQAFRISFIKCKIHVAQQSTTHTERQEILCAFWPGERGQNKSVEEINANNIQGYASFGNTKTKTLLWRSISSRTGIPGYGSALAITQADTILGMFFARNAIGNYISQTFNAPLPIGTAHFTLYVEFYDNVV